MHSDTRASHFRGLTAEGVCRSTRNPVARGWEGSAGLSSPPLGVESAVSPMWWSRGNSFDLLHSDPSNLGVKQNNRTVGPDVFSWLQLGMRAVF